MRLYCSLYSARCQNGAPPVNQKAHTLINFEKVAVTAIKRVLFLDAQNVNDVISYMSAIVVSIGKVAILDFAVRFISPGWYLLPTRPIFLLDNMFCGAACPLNFPVQHPFLADYFKV